MVAIVITVVLLIHDWSVTGVGWTVLIAGALLGSLAGPDAWTTRTAGSPAPVPGGAGRGLEFSRITVTRYPQTEVIEAAMVTRPSYSAVLLVVFANRMQLSLSARYFPERFSSCFDLVSLQNEDRFDDLPGAPGAAA